ncbi:MAG: hypothetical protein JWN16_696 [Alphaproteobacteria bacterium]|nr:hypothetical protein [Alphaproteobacteria bacterium]
MKAGLAIAALLLTGAATAQPVQPIPASTDPVSDLLAAAPAVTITNGNLVARIAPPDLDKGFYRGTRFDQAGVITSLKLGSKEFYGPWFERTAPDVLDYVYVPEGIAAGPDSAISGPVEEFAPLGYDDKSSPVFVKIGVGLLHRPDDKAYDHYRHYDIVSIGRRSIRTTANSITFRQSLDGAGYGYTYEKTLRLVPGTAQLVIEHVLKNTGGKPIVTTVYDHNFLRLAPGNEGVQVTFPFAVSAATPPAADLIRIAGKTLTYLRPMKDKERVSFPVTGFGATADDYDFRIADTKTGAGVTITGDQPLTRINIFSIDRVQSVEPYIAIDLAPGAQKTWRYTYTFAAPH